MKAKRLELIVGTECRVGEAEMVQRFQKLRDVRLLPISRGRNAEDITFDDIVSGLVSIVAERPGFAGMTAKVLRGLQPVGGPPNAFAKATTFAEALRCALENETLLDSVDEIRLTDSEVYTNCHGRATIFYRDADGARVTHYVHATAVSLLQPGREAKYDPRDLISPAIRETVIFPRLLQHIVREIRQDERHARTFARALGEMEATSRR